MFYNNNNNNNNNNGNSAGRGGGNKLYPNAASNSNVNDTEDYDDESSNAFLFDATGNLVYIKM